MLSLSIMTSSLSSIGVIFWSSLRLIIVQGFDEEHFTSYGKWTQDPDLLGVETVRASSRIRCCKECTRMPTCIGAAWKQDESLCQLATSLDNFRLTSLQLTQPEGWKFYVKDQYLCGYQPPFIDLYTIHKHNLGNL